MSTKYYFMKTTTSTVLFNMCYILHTVSDLCSDAEIIKCLVKSLIVVDASCATVAYRALLKVFLLVYN